jgi:hypothetical protein
MTLICSLFTSETAVPDPIEGTLDLRRHIGYFSEQSPLKNAGQIPVDQPFLSLGLRTLRRILDSFRYNLYGTK